MSKTLVGLLCLGAIALVARSFWGSEPNVFDPEGLEAALALGELVPASTIFGEDVRDICILGPYSSPEFQGANTAPSLTKQMQLSPVDEGDVRIATFGVQSRLLGEHDLPRGRGEIRIELEGIGDGFCQEAEVQMVSVIGHEEFVSIQFIR
ncbi:MAG: hypothetical protein ABJ327_07845 [Litoreibacter sp.]